MLLVKSVKSVSTDRFRSKGSNSGSKEFLSLHTLDEADISTSVGCELEAGNGLLHSTDLRVVRASNDNLSAYLVLYKRHDSTLTKSDPPGIESRAMTAARILVINSSRETTCLPIRWPHRFVWTWSSMCNPATPAEAYCLTVRATLIGPPKLEFHISVNSAERKDGSHSPRVSVGDYWNGRINTADNLSSL